jgi:hypothetical protein
MLATHRQNSSYPVTAQPAHPSHPAQATTEADAHAARRIHSEISVISDVLSLVAILILLRCRHAGPAARLLIVTLIPFTGCVLSVAVFFLLIVYYMTPAHRQPSKGDYAKYS